MASGPTGSSESIARTDGGEPRASRAANALTRDKPTEGSRGAGMASWCRGSVWRPRAAATMSLPVALALCSTIGFVLLHKARRQPVGLWKANARATADLAEGRCTCRTNVITPNLVPIVVGVKGSVLELLGGRRQ